MTSQLLGPLCLSSKTDDKTPSIPAAAQSPASAPSLLRGEFILDQRWAWLLTPSLAAHWTVVASVRAASLASAFKCKLQWTSMRDSTCGSRDEQLILPQWIKPTWSPPRHDLSSHGWHYVNSYWRSRQGKITKKEK